MGCSVGSVGCARDETQHTDIRGWEKEVGECKGRPTSQEWKQASLCLIAHTSTGARYLKAPCLPAIGVQREMH